KLLLRGIALTLWKPILPGIAQPAVQIETGVGRERTGHRTIERHEKAIVDFPKTRLPLVAEPVVHRELRADPPVVLRIAAVITDERLKRRVDRHGADRRRIRGRQTEQEARERIPVVGTGCGSWH